LKEASQDEAFFDLDELDDLGSPLTVRTFRAGDKMTPLGMQGVKKVQDIFVDDKVVRFKRLSVPLLVVGDELLWIAGLRQSERAKLTPETLRTLKLTWYRGGVK
jgi:tRNA(Ile)-lysidine synthase